MPVRRYNPAEPLSEEARAILSELHFVGERIVEILRELREPFLSLRDRRNLQSDLRVYKRKYRALEAQLGRRALF